jgi:Putative lumazine-binding
LRILDIYGGAASARVRGATWVDYMHLAKFNGRWRIINVLWENGQASCAIDAVTTAQGGDLSW